MATQSASIKTMLSILILLLASVTQMAFGNEEMNELESSDYWQVSPSTDRKAWEWATSGGSSLPDTVMDMVTLPNGDVFVAGQFRSSITVGSCVGDMAPNSHSGFRSLFLVKLSSNGSCQWITTISGGASVPATVDYSIVSIATDSNNDLFIASKVYSGGSYHFGNLTQTVSVGFVAKINNNGTWDWISEFQNSISTSSICISLDSNGDIFIASKPGSALNARISRFNSTGSYIDYTDIGGSTTEIKDLFIDDNDNKYVAGYFSGSVNININGSIENYQTANNLQKTFILKINASGVFDWFSTASVANSLSQLNSIDVGSSDEVYVSGHFYGDLELGSSLLSTGGNQRGIVAKLNSTGDWQWAIKIGGSGTTIPHEIVYSNNGGVIATGEYAGTLNVASINLPSVGGAKDVFVIKFNNSGWTEWAISGGGTGVDKGYRIGIDNFGMTYVSGDSEGNSIFGSNSIPSNGFSDIFLAKLSPDYDGDLEPDVNDLDDDDDFIADIIDRCQFSPNGFQSIGAFDHDGDGCRDSDEDDDDDDDGILDNTDSCAVGMIGWASTNSTDIDGDGCNDALEDFDDDGDNYDDYEDYCSRISGNSTMEFEKGCPDTDGDGRPDILDPFPNNASEYVDTDGDGVGDNSDVFPYDATQQNDTDGDGFGDFEYGNAGDSCPSVFGNSTIDKRGCLDTDGDGWSDEGDDFPDNPNEYLDSDNDGIPDHSDDFPYDPTQQTDSDGDGFGDNENGNLGDAFPSDPNKHSDSDRDGIDDENDAFPFDPSQQIDSDGDGFGDNSRGTGADKFPNDSSQWSDIDGDGYGDNQTGANSDQFPTDPTQHSDRDGDGWGDNLGGRLADLFPDNPTQWEDADGDGLGDNQSGIEPDLYLFDFDNDGFIDAIDILPKFASPGDLDADGCMDEGENPDVFPRDASECFDFDGDGLGDNEDTDDDGDGWADDVEIREGANHRDATIMPVDPFEIVIPGTNVGLGAWDLIGMFGGIPLFAWVGFGFVTRNTRCARFEERLRNATSRDELESIALDSEFALMMRLLGPHQGIRLERLRVEIDDHFESKNQSLSSLNSIRQDQTYLVAEEMNSDEKSRKLDEYESSEPSKDTDADTLFGGYEWLTNNGKKYYRNPNSHDEWKIWEE